jgi:hypothetical protein
MFYYILPTTAMRGQYATIYGNIQHYAVYCYMQCSAIFCQGRIAVETGGHVRSVMGWSRDTYTLRSMLVSACSDQETDEYPLRGLSNIRKLTYSIDPSVPWSEPL